MSRTSRPYLEVLEGKALLSVASPTTPGLVDTLTAVASRTPSGAQVVATLTETNVTNLDITVSYGPGTDGFLATQHGSTVWVSNGGINADYLQVDVLKPGQSLKISATWDGHSNQVNPLDSSVEGPAMSGTFTISNQQDQDQASTTVTIPKAWTTPEKVTHLAPPKPAAQHR